VPDFSAVKTVGDMPTSLCEPSQNGCVALRPQAHHAYRFPASRSTA